MQRTFRGTRWSLPLLTALLLPCPCVHGQQKQLTVTVEDGSGARVPGAVIVLRCSGQRDATVSLNDEGSATAPLPPGTCGLHVSAPGFSEAQRELADGESVVTVRLRPLSASAEMTVRANGTGIETNTPVAQATLGAEEIAHLPMFNRATGFTDLLTRTTPGVAADSNGFAHPLGEHADTSISLDGQPITDQQAKVFANQIDPSIIDSLNAMTGAPPAEFGDKTSLVVTVNTRSGLDHAPSATVSTEYGSFGTWAASGTMAAGTRRWGNFVAITANGSGRYLDSPEFRPMHDHGHGEAVFDRVDWQPTSHDQLHLNVIGGRSWFQTPNSYDAQATGQDQRSAMRNVNLAAGWTHSFSPALLTSFTPFVRHDEARYLPSANPLADATATLQQDRTLTNFGVRGEAVYAKRGHTAKLGSTYWRTLLHERFDVALTDPLYNALCVDTAGDAVAAPGVRGSAQCAAAGYAANPAFEPGLLPYDLTRGGSLYRFDQGATVEQAALYAQDDIKWGRWLLSPGIRYDIYNGLSRGRQVAPRLGLGYRTPWSGTLLRASYARLYETPYNENLIFANEHEGSGSAQTNPFASYRSEPVRPGTRNQFNIGFAQGFGSHITVDADYYWKFTHTAFDFDTLFNTPITFSVAWRKSKIDGLALRVNFSDYHGLSAYSVMGHVRSRFFTPQVGGLIFNSVPGSSVFRIDHGEEFEQTTHIRYQLPATIMQRHRMWVAGAWRYNSGLALPDTVPTYLDALQLSADEQSQMGLHCGSDFATPTRAIRNCDVSSFGATRVRIPALGTQNDDRNPVRVAPRTLLDLSAGDERLFTREHFTVGVRVSVINLTGKVALYNFLSTFSGTHFVPPRSVQAGFDVTF